MPRNKLSNMEIDEISLVDKGANQHAMITIAKRATEEEEMPELELFNEAGQPLDVDSLEDGSIVYDGEGQAYQFSIDEEENEEVEEKEQEPVGKSAFLNQKVQKNDEKSFSDLIMEELSKSYNDEDRDKVIAKALGRVEELEKRYSESERIAKSERDLRLTREYISKAAEYNVPVAPDELGPVLYRMAETMSYDDCAVIAKCLDASGAMLEEIGYQGGGANDDIMSQVEAHAVEIGKSAGAADIEGVFDESPEAYDQYLRAQRGL